MYNGIRGSVIRYSSGAGRGKEGVRESERPRRWSGYLSRHTYQIFWYTAYGMLFPHCLSYRKLSYFLRSALSGSLPSSDFNATFGRVVYCVGDSLQSAFTMNGQIFTPLSKGRHFRRFVSLGIMNGQILTPLSGWSFILSKIRYLRRFATFRIY